MIYLKKTILTFLAKCEVSEAKAHCDLIIIIFICLVNWVLSTIEFEIVNKN